MLRWPRRSFAVVSRLACGVLAFGGGGFSRSRWCFWVGGAPSFRSPAYQLMSLPVSLNRRVASSRPAGEFVECLMIGRYRGHAIRQSIAFRQFPAPTELHACSHKPDS